jgi:thiol-disulfide isomerase/thioredoxin
MNDSQRGGMIVAIIIFSLVVYYFLWVKAPAGSEPPGTSATNQTAASSIPDPNARLKVNDPAPLFAFNSLAGDNIDLSSFKGQKPVVLDFWATWCGPCKMELPKLQEFYSSHSDQVEIIAVTDEDAAALGTINTVVSQLGLTFPVIHDPSGSISAMYPTRGIPYVVFIDKNGVVIDTALGYNESIGDEIIAKFGLTN